MTISIYIRKMSQTPSPTTHGRLKKNWVLLVVVCVVLLMLGMTVNDQQKEAKALGLESASKDATGTQNKPLSRHSTNTTIKVSTSSSQAAVPLFPKASGIKRIFAPAVASPKHNQESTPVVPPPTSNLTTESSQSVPLFPSSDGKTLISFPSRNKKNNKTLANINQTVRATPSPVQASMQLPQVTKPSSPASASESFSLVPHQQTQDQSLNKTASSQSVPLFQNTSKSSIFFPHKRNQTQVPSPLVQATIQPTQPLKTGSPEASSSQSSPQRIPLFSHDDMKEKYRRCQQPENNGTFHPRKCTCLDSSIPQARTYRGPWIALQEVWRRRAAAAAVNSSIDVAFLGDSITELWNGTLMWGKLEVSNETPAIFARYYDSPTLKGLYFGSTSDTTNQLLWRLQDGVLPDLSEFVAAKNSTKIPQPLLLNPKVWLLLIGTNNVGDAGCNAASTLDSILLVIQTLSKARPNAAVLVHGLLPRGDVGSAYDRGDYGLHQVGRIWKMIQWINRELQIRCRESIPHCYYMEAPFENWLSVTLNSSSLQVGDMINATWMPDGLHPSPLGYEHWAPVIAERVQEVLKLHEQEQQNGLLR